MKKHPATSGLMPVKGSTCGIRPDLDAMSDDTGFDFSKAAELLKDTTQTEYSDSPSKHTTTLQEAQADSTAEAYKDASITKSEAARIKSK